MDFILINYVFVQNKNCKFKKKQQRVKVCISVICHKKSQILPTFKKVNYTFKKTCFGNFGISTITAKNVQVLLISSETVYLFSQLEKGGILHIHKQPKENPILFLIFMSEFSKEDAFLIIF